MIRIARIRSLVAASLLGTALILPGLQLVQGVAPQIARASAAHSGVPFSVAAGTWYNFDHHTRSVTHVTIAAVLRGLSVHTYGACHPTDCDWGSRLLTVAGAQASTTYHFSFADVAEYLYLSGPFLRVSTQTHFIDNSGRKDYTTQELFYNPSRVTHWVNVDPNTRNLRRLTLSFTPSGQGILSVYGACQPTDCPWGTQQSAASNPPVPMYFYYNQGFAQKEVVVTGNGDQVQAQTFVRFTDNSGRQNYHLIEDFTYAG